MFRKKKSFLEVIIGPESSIKGELITKGVARMDGAIEGNIDADQLIVGSTGMVRGEVVSRGVVIDGKIEGNIKSEEVVEIKSRGAVRGDIYTAKLIISEGAYFDGHSFMQKPAGTDNKDVLSFEQKLKKPV